MAIRLIVQMAAKPGKLDELVERFNVRISEVVKAVSYKHLRAHET